MSKHISRLFAISILFLFSCASYVATIGPYNISKEESSQIKQSISTSKNEGQYPLFVVFSLMDFSVSTSKTNIFAQLAQNSPYSDTLLQRLNFVVDNSPAFDSIITAAQEVANSLIQKKMGAVSLISDVVVKPYLVLLEGRLAISIPYNVKKNTQEGRDIIKKVIQENHNKYVENSIRNHK